MDLVEEVRSAGLLPTGEPVVVLLSGGRDSTCLLDVTARIAGLGNVRALHVDYGLRDDAAADAAHCERLCARLEVPLVVERPRRPENAPGNLQAWARDVRYAAAARLGGGAWVAAGHTADDQAETVLYRLATSPGRRALLGMAPRSGRLVRPLLGISREATAAHCRARGLDWVDDVTNDGEVFARSRVRHGLLAAMVDVDERAAANVVRTAAVLREEADVLDVVVATALAGRDSIELGHLASLPPALARLVVRRLAEDAVGGLCPRVGGRLDDILALGDGALDLGDGARAVVADGVLTFVVTPAFSGR